MLLSLGTVLLTGALIAWNLYNAGLPVEMGS